MGLGVRLRAPPRPGGRRVPARAAEFVADLLEITLETSRSRVRLANLCFRGRWGCGRGLGRRGGRAFGAEVLEAGEGAFELAIVTRFVAVDEFEERVSSVMVRKAMKAWAGRLKAGRITGDSDIRLSLPPGRLGAGRQMKGGSTDNAATTPRPTAERSYPFPTAAWSSAS
jgi:hypothetical protein